MHTQYTDNWVNEYGLNSTQKYYPTHITEKRQIFCQIFDRLCKMQKYALLDDPKILKMQLFSMPNKYIIWQL
jgi:hypothetical protein